MACAVAPRACRRTLLAVLAVALVARAAAQTKGSYSGVNTADFAAPGTAVSSFAASNVPCGATASGAAAGCDARGVFNGGSACVPVPALRLHAWLPPHSAARLLGVQALACVRC
jgi:hypothetical protein